MGLLVETRLYETKMLQVEMAELRVRQDVLAYALEVAHEELEKIQKDSSRIKLTV